MYTERINYQHNSYSWQYMKRLSLYVLLLRHISYLITNALRIKKLVCGFVCKYSSVILPIINIFEFWLLELICIMKDVNWILTVEVADIKLIPTFKNNVANYLFRVCVVRLSGFFKMYTIFKAKGANFLNG